MLVETIWFYRAHSDTLVAFLNAILQFQDISLIDSPPRASRYVHASLNSYLFSETLFVAIGATP